MPGTRLALLLALTVPVHAQVMNISLAVNFDRASLRALEASANPCAVMVAAAYRTSSDGIGTFGLSPAMLQQIVRSVAKSGPSVFGSCIAFEPGVVQMETFEGGRAGLE
jgi:hypothetical protein